MNTFITPHRQKDRQKDRHNIIQIKKESKKVNISFYINLFFTLFAHWRPVVNQSIALQYFLFLKRIRTYFNVRYFTVSYMKGTLFFYHHTRSTICRADIGIEQ